MTTQTPTIQTLYAATVTAAKAAAAVREARLANEAPHVLAPLVAYECRMAARLNRLIEATPTPR